MATEIIPFLWIGGEKDAEHVSATTALIINCTKNISFFSDSSTNIRIPVEDNGDPTQQSILVKHWTNALMDTLMNHIMQSKTILVHCQMGRQRSAATVAAFLIKNGMSKQAAIQFIQSKRREAFFPSVNFDDALNQYTEMIKNDTRTE
jgi:protein-tyrosine phosphatase